MRALVGHLVLAPSAKDPRKLTVDLEGVPPQLLWLALEHKEGQRQATRKPPLWGG